MLDHPERPQRAGRPRQRLGDWVVYLTIALLAGAVTALGVPWWLSVPVALALELVCGVGLQRSTTTRR